MVVAQQNWNNSDLLGKFSLTGCPTCYKLLYIVGQLQELEMSTIKEVLKENQKAVADYQKGKENSFTFLLGQVMAKSKGKANPQKAGELLKKALG